MMYCNAFGFIPALAKQVQKVCRMVWGVMFGIQTVPMCICEQYSMLRDGIDISPDDIYSL